MSPVELVNERLSLEALFQVNSDQPMRLYALEGFVPRAFVVSTPQGRAEASFPSEAQFSNAVGQSRLKIHVGDPLKGASAKVSRYSSGNVDVDVESSQAGLLVLMDNNYPGWIARVDTEPRPIQEIYPACRAVAVPAGRHRVAFSYEPPGFRRGLVISTVAVLLVLTILGMRIFTQSIQSKFISQV